VKPANVYRDPIEPIDTWMYDRLVGDYGLRPYTFIKHGWGKTLDGALVMPVHDCWGQELGHTTRTLTAPKRCMTYKATSQPWLDWWFHHDEEPKTTVIVEDQISACRLRGLGYDAIALLGTSMTTGQAKLIAKLATDPMHIVLALDRDAFLKALSLTKRHAHILKLLPICLDMDIKDMYSDEAICEIINGASAHDRRDSTTSGDMRQQGGI
jgi:hypothetical protein